MKFEEKFIAFIDILGFKSFVGKAEKGDELSMDKLLELTALLHNVNEYNDILDYGSMKCPEAKKYEDDINFKVTQISDCIISSSEVSPAGIINLLSHSWTSAFRLMKEGIMCRGYITKGKIHHEGNQIIGSGYQEAIEKEKSGVKVFGEQNEIGTPFVEIDPEIKKFVDNLEDQCVRKLFQHYTRSYKGFTALFPFSQFNFITESSISSANFEKEASKKTIELIRNAVIDIMGNVLKYVRNASGPAKKKAVYYKRFLDEQLDYLDQLDDDVDFFNSSIT